MSFNLINALVTFQSYINKTLKEHLNVICVVYFNDIIIYLKNKNKYEKHVHKILKYFTKIELYTKLKKCNFNVCKIHFLKYMTTFVRKIMK